MFSTNSKKYKLFNEDNLSFMKKLPNSSIDLILTDPPYNLAPFSRGNIHLKNGKTIHNDIAFWDNVPLIPQHYVEPFKRILKPTGTYSFSLVTLYLVNGTMLLILSFLHSKYSYGTKQHRQRVFIKIAF